MTIDLEKFVESTISEVSKKMGYNTCYLYSFVWVTDFRKFIGTLFKSKSLLIVLPSARDDKEFLANEIRQIARENHSTVMILFSEKLQEKNFIVCTKSK